MIKKQLNNPLLNTSVFIAYGLLITALSLKPHVHVEGIPYNDKGAHLIAYAVFTFLAWRIKGWSSLFNRLTIGIILYGGLIEILQSYTGRTMSFHDLLANITGVTLCIVGLHYKEKVHPYEVTTPTDAP